MYLLIVIGATGQGKTPFVRNYIENNNCIVFDIQNEYGEATKYEDQEALNLPTDNLLARSRYIGGDKDKFIELCKRKKNTICVFEEATIFFQGSIEQDMRQLIFSKAHTRNNYLLIFHSINAVPPRIMEAANYVILFKTNDEIKKVANKYNSLLKAFLALRAAKPDKQPIKIKMI